VPKAPTIAPPSVPMTTIMLPLTRPPPDIVVFALYPIYRPLLTVHYWRLLSASAWRGHWILMRCQKSFIVVDFASCATRYPQGEVVAGLKPALVSRGDLVCVNREGPAEPGCPGQRAVPE